MLIVCPACATEYTLDPDRVGTKGRIVRCARCKTSWFASAPLPGAAKADAARPPTVIDEVETISVSKRRPGRPRRKAVTRREPFRISPGLAAGAVFATLVLILSAISFRVPVVRAVPGSAALFRVVGLPVNVIGLALDDVSSAFGEEAGRRILVTEGAIANTTRRDLVVPDLELTVQGQAGETLYQWSAKPPAPEIVAGETKRFTVRLASPPPAGAHVLVTFLAPSAGATVASR